MALTLSEAAIISTTMEALLYGFSVLMYIVTLWIHLQNHKNQFSKPSYWFISLATILQVLAGAELIDNSVRVWQGLVSVGPFLPGGSETYFLDVSHHTFIVKGILYGLQTLILDGVVIYRTYVVWESVYPVILPVLGWFGLLAASIGANVTFAKTTGNVFDGEAASWVTAVYSLTLSTNLSASLLLAYRIWVVNREALRYRSRNRLTPVLSAVVESGAIYSATITIALILFVVNSVGVYVVLDMISPIICIVFNTIIIRVAFTGDKVPDIISSIGSVRGNITSRLGHGHDRDTITSLPRTRFGLGLGLGFGLGHGRRTSLDTDSGTPPHLQAYSYSSDGHQLRSLAVQITRHIETDVDALSSIVDTDRKDDNLVVGSRRGDR